jgi:hypothetical protein
LPHEVDVTVRDGIKRSRKKRGPRHGESNRFSSLPE